MPLQRAGLDAGHFELLRRAGGGRESFDLIAVSLGRLADGRQGGGLSRAGHAFQRENLVVAGENLVDRRALRLAQMRIIVRDRVSGGPPGQECGADRLASAASSPARARSSLVW